MTGRSWLLGLRRALTALLLLAAFMALGVLFLLHNEKGTAFLLQRGLAALPLDLTVESSSGALADGVTLRGLRYRSDKVEVSIGTAEIVIALGPLLAIDLVLPKVALADTTVRIVPDDAPREPSPLTIPRLRAPLPIRIDVLSAVNTSIVTNDTLDIERVDGALAWRDTLVTAGDLRVNGDAWRVNATGTVTLDDPVPVELAFDWAWTTHNVQGRGRFANTLAELAVEHELTGAWRLSSRGSVGLLNRIVPEADLAHSCDADCGVQGIEVTELALRHRGALDASMIDAEATVARTGLPPTRIVLRGQTQDRTLSIESATARGAALDLDLAGRVALAPAVDFDLTSRVRRLDAALVSPSLRGTLAGDAAVRGTSAEHFRAVLRELRGELNGYALTGSADVERRGGRLDLKPLRVSLGDNALLASGTVAADKLQLEVDATLSDLAQVDPRLAGALSAKGRVDGSPREPRGRFVVDGEALQFAGLTLATLGGDLNIDAAGAVGGKLSATGLARGERELGAANLVLGGSLDAIEVAAGWRLPDTSLDTTLVVRRTDGGVRGEVKSAQLEVATLGTWATDAPFAIDVARGTARVEAHTWRNGPTFMQVDDLVVGEDIVLNAQLADMPLQTFTPFLPPAVRLSGAIDASVALARERGDWRGNVDWHQRGTLLQFARGKRQRRMALPTFDVGGQLAGQTLRLEADIRGDYGLSVYGDVNITGAGIDPDPAIDGIFAATMPDLGWLGPWLDGVSEVAGNGAINLNASGTVTAPALRGVIALNDAALSLDDAGLRIEKLSLRGEGREGATIDLTGHAVSGGGELDLTGTVVSPWNDRRSVEINIKGKDVQAFNAQNYQVWISPDLNLAATAAGATLSGRVDVPRADIRVAEVPENVVRTSSDIKVEGRVEDKGIALPVSGNITLSLGERVHVFALGLDTDLRGDLELTIDEGKAPTFNGRVYLENGKYAAYGQKLSVERGNLYYAGPIDNPVLDFRATRAIRDGDADVVAGVRVTGPARSPAIDVFAEPAMSQTEALSYLILGRSSLTATGSDGESLSQAALAFGLSRSSPLTTQLAGGLGLDELTVSGDSVDNAELVAGKQLSDRLYVRYSFGVFSNLGAILLRYRLSSRLALEAGSADAHSLDVLYTIEK